MNLSHLNDKQQEAVKTIEGPCIIIAGAGSGKTSVLTHRVAYLISQGIAPHNILALTFTNKAAKEMKDRVEKLLKSDVKSLWIGTFHSIFLRILKIEHEAIGFEKNFSIYDTDDSKSLITEIVNYLNLDKEIYKPNIVLSRISSAKNNLISHLDYANNQDLINEDEKHKRPMMKEIYSHYATRCKNSFAMDFDDLILHFYNLLKNNKDILNKYQNLFKHFLVDEFQDTNFAQYEVVKLLANAAKNLCVVGDDAQSIYAFRGATISNILNFEKDFPKTKIIKLEQNYRSTKSIVGLADSIIKNNTKQIPKSIWTDNQQGDTIQVIRTDSDLEEAIQIGKNILDTNASCQTSFFQFAVLYRSNFQSRVLEQAFANLNIPYKLIGALSFYERKEIKDVLAYIKVIINQHDNESLKRIVNLPRRGIGVSTLNKLTEISIEEEISIWKALDFMEDHFAKTLVNKLEDFRKLILKIKVDIVGKSLYEQVKIIVNESGLLKELFEENTPEAKVRYENLQEFLNSVLVYSRSYDDQSKDLSDFMQDLALVNSPQENEDENKDVVSLMTVHSSKGLEFDYVFLVGMEEDIFPSALMISNASEIEEERRLFYVATTRAKIKLTISYVLTRYRFGRIKNCAASRFLSELNPNFIQQIDKKSTITKLETAIMSKQKTMLTSFTKDKKRKSSPSFCFDISKLNIGTQVIHPKFSVGIITQLFPSNIDSKVSIKFKQYGEKTFLLKYASLQVIGDNSNTEM